MKVIITENQLKNLKKSLITEDGFSKLVDTFSSLGKLFGVNNGSEETSDDTKTTNVPQGTSGEPIKLDLRKDDDFKKYSEICQKFVSKYRNPLHITGDMLATGAKRAFIKTGNYVPPELALSQLLVEGGLTAKDNSRPIRTKNPFNVGNVDAGGNIFHNDVQSGIDAYYDLISRKYLTGGKKVSDLISNFTNQSGNRYASDKKYETNLAQISKQVSGISNQVMTT